jgi:hypothetical protein
VFVFVYFLVTFAPGILIYISRSLLRAFNDFDGQRQGQTDCILARRFILMFVLLDFRDIIKRSLFGIGQ